MDLFGALEAGGTKMVLAVLDSHGTFLEKTTLPTRTPEETMPVMTDFFRGFPIRSLGIGCFGPLDLNPRSEFRSAWIPTSTPPPWRNPS